MTKFLTKEGVSPHHIHERLVHIYQDQSPSYFTVKNWSAEFKRGRDSFEDDLRCGRPLEVMANEVCDSVEMQVMNDRRIKTRNIAGAMGISKDTVQTILHDKHGLSKVCALWVPRMLSAVQRADRVDMSRANLDLFNSDPENFYLRVVTGDEAWLHHYDPESKLQSMQWKYQHSPPKKFRVQASVSKVISTIFWDAKGVIHIDYMPPKNKITWQYDWKLLKSLRDSIKEERRIVES